MKFYEAMKKMDKDEKFCICDNNPDIILCIRNNILFSCVRGSFWQPNVFLNDTWFMSNRWRVVNFKGRVNGFPEPPLNESFMGYNK